ncbi:MAG: hypothetical protein CMJ36_03775 [Phycisphaerae bacterium]|nr:hypothetical protein [Phycisphaerae bacterium]
MITLNSLLRLDCIKHPLESSDSRGAINELVNLLHEHGLVQDPEDVADAVWERELQRTTGIGEGLAVPHGRCPSLDKVVAAVGYAADPIDFKANDGKPVELIVLIVSPPDNTTEHVQALSAISRVLGHQATRNAAFACETAEALHALLCNGADD